jgi:hypothetical protein
MIILWRKIMNMVLSPQETKTSEHVRKNKIKNKKEKKKNKERSFILKNFCFRACLWHDVVLCSKIGHCGKSLKLDTSARDIKKNHPLGVTYCNQMC